MSATANQPSPDLGEATGTEREVCLDIAARQILGIQKYGTTVENNPLSLREWLQHAYEECLDHAVYLKRAISEIRVSNETVKQPAPMKSDSAPEPEKKPSQELDSAGCAPAHGSGGWGCELPNRPGKWECRIKDGYMHAECGWPLFSSVTFHVFEKSGGLHAYNGEEIYGVKRYTGGNHWGWRYLGPLHDEMSQPEGAKEL
jgi:hypothetical protein